MDKDPTPLIRPLYFGPLVVILTGFHCTTTTNNNNNNNNNSINMRCIDQCLSNGFCCPVNRQNRFSKTSGSADVRLTLAPVKTTFGLKWLESSELNYRKESEKTWPNIYFPKSFIRFERWRFLIMSSAWLLLTHTLKEPSACIKYCLEMRRWSSTW